MRGRQIEGKTTRWKIVLRWQSGLNCRVVEVMTPMVYLCKLNADFISLR